MLTENAKSSKMTHLKSYILRYNPRKYIGPRLIFLTHLSAVPCFVVFPSFTDAFPAVFLAITFVCLSFPSQNRDLNFPAALGETAGKASEEVY